MTGKQTVLAALAHRSPGRVPLDLGSTFVSGIHVSCVAALRDYYGLSPEPVRLIDCGQMLGEVREDLKRAIGIDVEGVVRRMNRFGFPNEDWKPWRLNNDLEVLVPGRFNLTIDDNGDALLHPEGDTSIPPSARMPKGGYFFDNIVRQQPIDEDRLDPADNMDFGPLSDCELDHLVCASKQAAATGRAVMASFGGTGLGDIAWVPGPGLRNPKGIRDITEWYISIRSRRSYIHKVFEAQVEVAIANLGKIAARVADSVDVLNVCGTDFGTQTSSFCSVETFRELWLPYYRRINDWVHSNTNWKTFKHSCGAVGRFIPSFLEAGFDILNPVQCSATGMEPERLKEMFGDRLTFWGGGVDTQRVLPFGTRGEVRDMVLRRCEVFARGGGFVFNPIHNIQAETPVRNIVAMIDAVHEFNGQ